MSCCQFQAERWKTELVGKYFTPGSKKDKSVNTDRSGVTKPCLDIDLTSEAENAEKKTSKCIRRKKFGGKLLENCVYDHLSGDQGRSCVSVVLKSGDRRLDDMGDRLAKVEQLAEKENVRWIHKSSSAGGKVRLDLSFWSSISARTFFKSVGETESWPRLMTSFLLAESDLGYELKPVLSEQDLLMVQSPEYRSNIFNTNVDCRIEVGADQKFRYRFSSVTDLNLFLFICSSSNLRALGSLRRSQMYRELHPDSEGYFRLITSDELTTDFSLREKFKIIPRETFGHCLMFSLKIELFEFLISENARRLDNLQFDQTYIYYDEVMSTKFELERSRKVEQVLVKAVLHKDRRIKDLVKDLNKKDNELTKVKIEKIHAINELEVTLADMDKIHNLSLSIYEEPDTDSNI